MKKRKITKVGRSHWFLVVFQNFLSGIIDEHVFYLHTINWEINVLVAYSEIPVIKKGKKTIAWMVLRLGFAFV